MGSTLLQLRSLLEEQIDSGVTDSNSNPTSTILNIYINKAIRKITRDLKPRELLNSTPASVDIVSGQNTAIFPATLYVPTSVWYKSNSSSYKELIPTTQKDLIIKEGSSNFFNTDNSGDPSYYALAGLNMILNKYFSRSETGAIKVYGINYPTSLAADATANDLPEDYDLLITYLAAMAYYQKDEDFSNQNNYMNLYNIEKQELLKTLKWNYEDVIELNPYMFGSQRPGDKGDVMMTIGS